MGLLNNAVDWLIAFATGFFGNVLAHDFCEVAPMMSKKIIEIAASRLPLSIRDRYLEEWRADLHSQPGMATKLLWSVGCLISTYRLRHEARIDQFRRVSFQIALPRGETVMVNLTTFALMGALMYTKAVGRRWHVPSVLVAPYVVFVLKPFTDWRWHQPADLLQAFSVLTAGFPWKIIKHVDGVPVEEPKDIGLDPDDITSADSKE
jgi:hypothetical protein